MFRRKEDSLFDNSTDPNEVESTESATLVSPQPAGASTSSSSAPAYLSQASTSAPSRPAAPAPTPAPAASSFRPGSTATAPLATGDLSRSRLPEAKPQAQPAQPASSFSVSGSMPSASVVGSNKSGKRVLTVGNDILLKGEIATCDRLVIEGKVDATLNDVHTVEIAETGSFRGAAHIEDAEISGLFEGDLIVRNRLVIYATGRVRGKITYGEIEIERGGELTGEIKSSSSGSQSATPRTARQKEAA